MSRTTLDVLTRRVTEHFRRHAGAYHLDPRAAEARYILNWGGFVNASFSLTDGLVTYHLKLADEPDAQERLARWMHFSPLLAENYRAPRVIEWVKIPRTPFAGLLCESVPGSPADLAAQPRVREGVLKLLARLHADAALSAALTEIDGAPLYCSEYFLSIYIDRFDEDLLIIAGDLPPFVPLPVLDWMMGETRELEGLARDLPAFQEPAAAPTHGDLWQNNILVPSQGPAGQDFHIIDWDDLSLGDPALDYSILLGPLLLNGSLTRAQVDPLLPADPLFRQRFDLCLRALLLDQVIDPLADWVEASFAPDHQSDLRPAKESTHRAALQEYRRLYP